MTITFDFDWIYEPNPGWDSTGTIAESWSAEVGRYVARIDRFRDEDGGGFAYTVALDGNPIRNGENESAESFEAAECAIRRLLADRI